MSLDVDMQEIAQIFIEESLEGLDVMEAGLLNLDLGAADPETINEIFRAAHSIKGGGATFGFTEISDFAHVAETLLDEMRQNERDVTREAVDLLLASVDCIRDMIGQIGDGEIDVENANAVRGQLEALLANEAVTSATPDAAAAEQPSVESGPTEWHITFVPAPGILRSYNDPIRIIRELEGLGELSVECHNADSLALGEFDPEECLLAWELILVSDAEQAEIEDVFAWVRDECELSITAAGQATPEPATPSTEAPQTDAKMEQAPEQKSVPAARKPVAKQKTATAQESSSIRVNIDKVDALINQVGELVITQSMLSRFTSDFDFTQLDLLREGLSQLSRNTRELQESVMAIRMLPISFAFSRFPRLVRDTGNAIGKKVELQLTGENTELDKTVLEKIGDPLVHLVRNSLDHGLEDPEARVAAGKPETGVLQLNAYHEGGNIVIEVSDDGAGINTAKVLEKARARGLVGMDEQLPAERINNLIFMAGFSTADEVSDLSGRGVGMDVVRRNISDLGGTVSIKSEPGIGSTITIRLPLTLAILDGQLVRVGEQCYIVPLISIVETIQVTSDQVSQLAGHAELFKLRDTYLPVLRLHELFGVACDSKDITDGLLVVAEANGQRIGILVDDLLEQQQVVIKSLDANYKQVQGISGATILGDGTVALILDTQGLLQIFYSTNTKLGKTAVA